MKNLLVVAAALVVIGFTQGSMMNGFPYSVARYFGVRFFGGGTRTQSLIMTLDEREIRFIDSVHLDKGANDVRVRFY